MHLNSNLMFVCFPWISDSSSILKKQPLGMFILQLSKYTAGHKPTPLQISLFFLLVEYQFRFISYGPNSTKYLSTCITLIMQAVPPRLFTCLNICTQLNNLLNPDLLYFFSRTCLQRQSCFILTMKSLLQIHDSESCVHDLLLVTQSCFCSQWAWLYSLD